MRLRRQGLTWKALDDEIVLLDLDSSIYFAARGNGAVLLQLLQADTNRLALVDALASRFPATPVEAIAEDVDTFLGSLRDRGLLDEEP